MVPRVGYCSGHSISVTMRQESLQKQAWLVFMLLSLRVLNIRYRRDEPAQFAEIIQFWPIALFVNLCHNNIIMIELIEWIKDFVGDSEHHTCLCPIYYTKRSLNFCLLMTTHKLFILLVLKGKYPELCSVIHKFPKCTQSPVSAHKCYFNQQAAKLGTFRRICFFFCRERQVRNSSGRHLVAPHLYQVIGMWYFFFSLL